MTFDQIDTVMADLEMLKDIRRASRDLKESELDNDALCLTLSEAGGKGLQVASVRIPSFWFAHVAIDAMEREVLSRLAAAGVNMELEA